jgi:UDP-N-acetylglucosamine--N-acetylmuramyl-(pentapeptide) pyrophosphoryl-undecaprenol N-acetylglucosamine transferase
VQVSAKVPVIVFTGGGTGGHVYPGIAVLQAFRQTPRGKACRFVWIGSQKGIERKVVEGLGIEYHPISTGKLRRYVDWENLTDLVRIVRGYFQSKSLLKELKPLFVFSKGGFVSVPPVQAAKSLRIPVFSHESDLDPGLATRLNLKASRLVFCAYPESRKHFGPAFQDRVIVTGNPVRQELFEGDPGWIRRTWTVPVQAKVLLVLGGSLGARQVNELVAASLGRLDGRVFLVHQTGEHWDALPDTPWYVSRPFFSTEMPHLYAGADLIFGRAGAGTLWEAAASGVPLVLLPLGSGSRGDQVRNAQLFADRGAAVVLGAIAGPDDLTQAVERFLSDSQARDAARKALAGFDAPGAAQRIAAQVLDCLGAADV